MSPDNGLITLEFFDIINGSHFCDLKGVSKRVSNGSFIYCRPHEDVASVQGVLR